MDRPLIVEQPEGGGPSEPAAAPQIEDPPTSWITRFWKEITRFVSFMSCICCSSSEPSYQPLQNGTASEETVQISPEELRRERRLARIKENLERELQRQAEEKERFIKEQERKDYEFFFVHRVEESELPKETEEIQNVEKLGDEQKLEIQGVFQQSHVDFASSSRNVQVVDHTQLTISEGHYYQKDHMIALPPKQHPPFLVKRSPDNVSSRRDALYCLASVHPNIMAAVNSTVDESLRQRFLIMSFNGKPLTEYKSLIGGRYGFSRVGLALMVTRQLGQAVKFLRYNWILHRQVCLANIFIDDRHVRLANFEMATEVERKLYEKIGDCKYQAPEMFTGQGYSFEADWYSIGVCFYVFLHDAKPTSGMDEEEMEKFYDPVNYKIKINKDHHSAIFRMTHHFLSLRPEMRYTPNEIIANCGTHLYKSMRNPTVYIENCNKEEDFLPPKYISPPKRKGLPPVVEVEEQESSNNVTADIETKATLPETCDGSNESAKELPDNPIVTLATEVLATCFGNEEILKQDEAPIQENIVVATSDLQSAQNLNQEGHKDVAGPSISANNSSP